MHLHAPNTKSRGPHNGFQRLHQGWATLQTWTIYVTTTQHFNFFFFSFIFNILIYRIAWLHTSSRQEGCSVAAVSLKTIVGSIWSEAVQCPTSECCVNVVSTLIILTATIKNCQHIFTIYTNLIIFSVLPVFETTCMYTTPEKIQSDHEWTLRKKPLFWNPLFFWTN